MIKPHSQDENSISKEEYDNLNKKYQELFEQYEKLERRFNLVMKQSDRQFSKKMVQISLHEKEKRRSELIFKQSDSQGKTLLDKTYTLEEQLMLELEYQKELLQEISQTQKEVVLTMGAIGESRSQETGNHVVRVAEYSKLLGLYSGIGQEEAELLKEASPMHDIGKIAIPDMILHKPGSLDAKEWKIMQTHAELGYEMLKHSQRPILKAAATVAIEHHEKWDGSGYPKGLKGEQIHIFGRITALADVFDALSADRCYKKAWKDEEIFDFFKREKGKHFDPNLVDIFFKHMNEFLAIREKFKDI